MIIADQKGDVVLPVFCPKCGSTNCEWQATGRKTGTVIGGVAGAFMSRIATGVVGGAMAAKAFSKQPTAIPFAAIAGALAGFIWGAKLGHEAGILIDQNVLKLCRCLDCDAEFNR